VKVHNKESPQQTTPFSERKTGEKDAISILSTYKALER